MNRSIMAAIVASITVFVNVTAIISAAKGTPLQTQGLPRCLVPLPREWRPTGHVFLASSCLIPNKGILFYLIRIIPITDRTNQELMLYNQEFCS